MRRRTESMRGERRHRASVTAAVLLLLAGGVLSAQPRQRLDLGPDLTSAEVERLFDAFVLVQAQDALELTDDQFAPFVSRLKALQEVRGANQRSELQLLRTAQRLAADPDTAETEIAARLEELEDHRTSAAEAVRAAYAAIDAVLEVRQRVQFRLFERRMERRKLELVMRAGRARPAPTPQRRPRATPPR